jgi:hypothetical protein
MESSSLEAVFVLTAHRSTEGNSPVASKDCAVEEAATENSPLDCSLLEGSKTHADTGQISPLQLVVLCTVHDINSDKCAHRYFPVLPVGGKLETAAMGGAVSCLKRNFEVPSN